MSVIVERPRETEVIEDVDVCVVGGGPGGFPAAMAAARRGCKTLLVERYGFLGGLGTGGLMGPFFGYAHRDHPPILGGIPMEVIRELQSLGGAPPDEEITWSFIRFFPEMLKHAADRLVLGSGAKILLHSYAVDVALDGDRVDAVIIECKSGRKAIRARQFIDATGDADISFLSGCPYRKGRAGDGLLQSMGTKFRIGGVARNAETSQAQKEVEEFVKQAIDDKRLPAYHPIWGEWSRQGITLRDDEATPTVTRCPGDGTNVYHLTRAELKIRADTLKIVDFYRKHVPGYENAYLMETPAQVGVRETRQVLGDYVLAGDDVANCRRFDDAIARGCWFMDIHCPAGFYTSQGSLCSRNCHIEPGCRLKHEHPELLPERTPMRDQGPDTWYHIPYRCIVPQKIENLLVSGRCISADSQGMSSARVMPTCFALGEAAGTAAALSLRQGVAPRKVDVADVQAELRGAGVPL